jgi:hypothetical protein
MENKDNMKSLQQQAKVELEVLIKREGITIVKLVEMLNEYYGKGTVTYQSTIGKIRRGKYPMTFFLMVLTVLGKEFEVSDSVPQSGRKKLMDHLKFQHGILVGANMSEKIIDVCKEESQISITVKGLCASKGIPKKKRISSAELVEVINHE